MLCKSDDTTMCFARIHTDTDFREKMIYMYQYRKYIVNIRLETNTNTETNTGIHHSYTNTGRHQYSCCYPLKWNNYCSAWSKLKLRLRTKDEH